MDDFIKSPLERGRIDRLEITNFKSYRGTQIIGPFSNFTCIVGPNGSGKSNLMDAISFALGLKARFLRSSNLKQLIYNYQDSSGSETKAIVKLYFINPSGDEIEYFRSITINGSSLFKIKGKRVSQEKYVKSFEKYGVLVQARNFLVFQGDVESIAAKTPKELGELFEKVSGSIELKREYERLKNEMEKATDAVITCNDVFKGAKRVHTSLKAQTRAEKQYKLLVAEHDDKVIEHILWRLYHIEREICVEKKKVGKKTVEENEQSEKLNKFNKDYNVSKSEFAKIQKNSIKENKKFQEHKRSVQENVKKKEKLLVQTQHLEKGMVSINKKLKKKKKKLKLSKKHVKQLESEIAKTREEMEEFEEEENERQEQNAFGNLQKSELKEYRELKEKSNVRSITIQQEMEKLKSDFENTENRIKTFTKEIEQYESEVKKISTNITTVKERYHLLTETKEKEDESLKEKEKKISDLQYTKERKELSKKNLEKKIEDVRDQLRDARVEKHENELEIKINHAVDAMKNLFTTVYGRISDLFTVSRDKYKVAVDVALGLDHNSIVVDTYKTALECIEYLKEQRIKPLTFLPLDTIKPKVIQERLRGVLGQDAKLAVDVVQASQLKFEKVIKYVFGNTIICTTLEMARGIAYDQKNVGTGGKPKYKIVTLNGSIIHKTGLITGGNYETLQKKASSSVKSYDVKGLTKMRDENVEEFHDVVQDLSNINTKIGKIQTECEKFENRIKYCESDMKFADRKLKKYEKDLRGTRDELKIRKDKLGELKEANEERDDEIKEKRESIKNIESEIFRDFSRKVNIPDIEEFEENRLKFDKSAIKKRSNYDTLLSRLEEKLEYEKEKMEASEVDELEKEIEESNEKLKNLKKQQQTTEKKNVDLEKKAKKLSTKIQKLTDEKQKKEVEMNKIEKMRRESENQIKNVEKVKNTLENKMDQLRNRRNDICNKCKLKEIDIPYVEEVRKKRKKKRKKKRDDDSMDERDDDFDFIALSEPFEVTAPITGEIEAVSPGKRKRKVEEEKVQIDFDVLREQKDILEIENNEYEEIDESYMDDLKEMEVKLEKLSPNVSNKEKEDSAKDKKDSTEDELNEAKENAQECTKKFEEIKDERKETFMEAFKQSKANIDKIYKKLTESVTFPLGGVAHLGLEDQELPYEQGIKYVCLPPVKRYRKMQELSGGEKSIAALALLFSIHAWRTSPFFVLDEIDASLDNVNVSKIANYIKEESKNSDTLIGVYTDREEKSAKVATLDLRKYDEDDE